MPPRSRDATSAARVYSRLDHRNTIEVRYQERNKTDIRLSGEGQKLLWHALQISFKSPAEAVKIVSRFEGHKANYYSKAKLEAIIRYIEIQRQTHISGALAGHWDYVTRNDRWEKAFVDGNLLESGPDRLWARDAILVVNQPPPQPNRELLPTTNVSMQALTTPTATSSNITTSSAPSYGNYPASAAAPATYLTTTIGVYSQPYGAHASVIPSAFSTTAPQSHGTRTATSYAAQRLPGRGIIRILARSTTGVWFYYLLCSTAIPSYHCGIENDLREDPATVRTVYGEGIR